MTNWLWVIFTVIAAAAQTARNAAQRELTASLGTAGATNVRFLFGIPFGLLFLIATLLAIGGPLPRPPAVYWPWILLGCLAQTAATGLMLTAMTGRSFVVVYAFIKTEPILVALFGFVLLGETVTLPMAAAIMVATAGVAVMSLRRGVYANEFWPTLLGLSAAGLFGLSAIGYRGAIVSLDQSSNLLLAASYSVVIGLGVQAGITSLYLWWENPRILSAILRAWRGSLFAGFSGALASQFWLLAFATATAASVRTLALVEVLFAQAISTFIFRQPTTSRELVGIVLIVAGVLLLLWAY
ncbi:MAG TPA: DMT family transporter [Xanthobacteraceae bacterium]|nr:DMT family transporter [Xanthobacteraceae bacterium]